MAAEAIKKDVASVAGDAMRDAGGRAIKAEPREDAASSALSEPGNELRVVVDLREQPAGEPGVVLDLRHDGGTDPEIVVDLREIDLRPWLSPDAGLLNASRQMLALQRTVDVAGAIVGLLVLLPLLLVVAVAVKATSPGPVLFKQRRVGRGGAEFEFYKFRSMVDGAEGEGKRLQDLNEATGPVFKMRSDPRMTRVGRWIRQASIDELPQLWNVLKGDMRLVGPRPPIPSEVAEYGDWERQRLLAKPGITCIWQVSGRSNLDFETWVAMDIEYIENWSPSLDLSLVLRTIPAVLSQDGAY